MMRRKSDRPLFAPIILFAALLIAYMFNKPTEHEEFNIEIAPVSTLETQGTVR